MKSMRIISGGQTGVDRAALDSASGLRLIIGGWCPAGRRAEDGRIPEKYPLQETSSRDYRERTRLNVRDADGTLVLFAGDVFGGTALTAQEAMKMRKPLFMFDVNERIDTRPIIRWLRIHRIRTLNVAGPRESESPGIYHRSKIILDRLFRRIR